MSDESRVIDKDRRRMIKTGFAGAALVAAGPGRVAAATATGSDEIRVGLVGCGKRGTGAAANALAAAPNVKLVAIGDLFKDVVDESLKKLQGDETLAGKVDVPPERLFVGFDAYRRVLATDCNYVILASPPGFRPAHLQAAVTAGKHIFTEKPMAVDGPGIRTCFEVAEEAARNKLAVGVGLQRHHSKGYVEALKRVRGGALGPITSGRCSWMQGALWIKRRQPTWTDVEWQIRNWLYFTWLSGDHIVEQHIHNIDIVQWAIGKPPVAAVATGGRQQRTDPAYGHIYDHFAVDFEYPDDVHVLSMSRQTPNCHNDISEHLTGPKGRADFNLNQGVWRITGRGGKVVWAHDGSQDPNPYVQEHTALIESIRRGKPANELRAAAESNLAAIMGRMAAYTGKRVTWEQALESQDSLFPAGDLKFGQMGVAKVAIPGTLDVI